MAPNLCFAKGFRAVSLTLLFFFSACREEVVHSVDESRANRIVAALENLEIGSTKKRESDGRWTILVNQRESSRVIRFLSERRLLPIERASADGAEGMLPTREGQSFRLERRMSAGIEDTLRSVQGVLDARVHLNLGVQRDLFDPRLPEGEAKSGSVLLIVTPDYQVPLADIAALVGQASGIDPKAVAVIHVIESATSAPSEKQPQAVLPIDPRPQSSPFAIAITGFGAFFLLLWGWWWIGRRRPTVRLPIAPPAFSMEQS
jgi:type III secretory pathway lipoprotein EscJ